jgi:hypothetical protein
MIDMATYMRDRRARRRAAMIALLGGKCVRCGTTDRLEIDHIDPATKLFALSGYDGPWAKVLTELRKCQLLCYGEHKEKSDSEESVEHGGGITGRKNCRCNLCAPLKNAYRNQPKYRRCNYG